MSIDHLPSETRSRLNDLWSVAEKAGLHRAVKLADAALEGLGEAQERQRIARAALDDAKVPHTEALAFAVEALSIHVEKEGAKTFLHVGETRRAVTADEARSWLEREAARDPEVIAAAKVLAEAKTAAMVADQGLELAAQRVSLSRHALDASNTLTRLLASAFATEASAALAAVSEGITQLIGGSQ